MKVTNELRSLAEGLRAMRRFNNHWERVKFLRVLSILVIGHDVVKENA